MLFNPFSGLALGLAFFLPLTHSVAVAAPTSDQKAPFGECTLKSVGNMNWTVHDFNFHASYIFTTPAHQNSWGYVDFMLENPALKYQARCHGASTQLQDFFYGQLVYWCTVPVSGDEVSFTYSRPSGELKINQTWHCPGEGSRFEAEGGVTLSLECTDTEHKNPDWKIGEIYSTQEVKCNNVTTKASMDQLRGAL